MLEKVDIDRALRRLRLTERERAMAALLCWGWSFQAIGRVLRDVHPQQVSRFVAGLEAQPGLAARIEAVLNGQEETP